MSFRDFLWDYPLNLKRIYKSTIPLSHILTFTFLAFVFFAFAFSDTIVSYLTSDMNERFVEGVIGSSTRLNPLFLTSNQIDRDIQELVFTKFIEIDEKGDPLPAIAKSWSKSNDSRSYTFKIRDDMYWQDGTKLTSEDIVFTFEYARELFKKYSLDTIGSSFSDVNFEKINDYTVKFVLPEVNSTFYESISVYVVPKHILHATTPQSFAFTQFDSKPIGSGPYYIDRNTTGEIVLKKNTHYYSSINIPEVVFKFYNSYSELETAFKSRQLDAFGTYQRSDIAFVDEYKNRYNVNEINLPYRKKIIFFNTRLPQFANSSIRKGITYLIDKEKLLKDSNVLGKVSNSPLPNTSWAYLSSLDYIKYDQKKAADELKLAGFTKNQSSGFFTSSDGKILSIDITYLENDLNTRLVNTLVKSLESEGVLLNPVPKTFDQITREVLASRDFELILYEIEVSVDPDQYNIWHSLKSDFPNLNISGFKFERVDVYLERARKVVDISERYKNYVNFQKALLNDNPAIFLYEPSYLYIVRNDIENFNTIDVKFLQQRFKNIEIWKYN